MVIRFQLFGNAEKRWHHKVAKAAAERLTDCLQSSALKLNGALAADFCPGDINAVEIRHDSERKVSTILFSTGHWGTMAASVDDAIEQLASAVMAMVPPPARDSLSKTFITSGIRHTRGVRRVDTRITADNRTHFYLKFLDSHLSLDELHRIYDQLDAALRVCGVGEANGSGVGIEGMHVDVSLTEKGAGLDVISMFIRERNLKERVRLIDARSGLESPIPEA
ncbi:MAG: hypothetical protein V4773_24040 [Verrucomicrobiota bacterium]